MSAEFHALLHQVRSKLFVPGSRPELFAKAYATQADAVSIDLEDAVHTELKGGARQSLSDWLDGRAARGATKLTIVRVNPVGSDEFVRDMAACVRPGVDVINLPKLESASQIEQAERLLGRLERDRNITRPIALLANIESPAGLRHAAEIALAGSRVAGLQLGLGDLLGGLGVHPRNAQAMAQARFLVRCAAAEAGVAALDSACADVEREQVFVHEAQQARSMGFTGKSCIHPRQVAWAHQVFRVAEEQLAYARRLLSAQQSPENARKGAFLFEGTMVDTLHLRQAHQLLAGAGRHD